MPPNGNSKRRLKQVAPGVVRVATEDGKMESLINKNVNWVGPRFWLFYVFSMISFEWIANAVFVAATGMLTTAQGLTLVHVGHAIINFFVMHYLVGTPGELQDSDDFAGLSFWEQLDDGISWSFNRKMMMSICISLFLITSHLTEYELNHLTINVAALVLCVIPKLPQFDRIRFGSVAEE
jgi:hypothetical protein